MSEVERLQQALAEREKQNKVLTFALQKEKDTTQKLSLQLLESEVRPENNAGAASNGLASLLEQTKSGLADTRKLIADAKDAESGNSPSISTSTQPSEQQLAELQEKLARAKLSHVEAQLKAVKEKETLARTLKEKEQEISTLKNKEFVLKAAHVQDENEIADKDAQIMDLGDMLERKVKLMQKTKDGGEGSSNVVLQSLKEEIHAAKTEFQDKTAKKDAELAKVLAERDVAAKNYQDLRGKISGVEQRMLGLHESDEEKEVVVRRLSTSNDKLAIKNTQLQSDLNIRRREISQLMQSHSAVVAAKELEIKSERARAESALVELKDVQSTTKRRGSLLASTTAALESELEGRNAAMKQQSVEMDSLFQENKDLTTQLDMSKARLESVRDEFKSFKESMTAEINSLKNMVVSSQQELGQLKGSTDSREALVNLAQQKLRALSPWLGIEIVSGPSNGVRVVNVKPGGPAKLAGFHTGDIIEQANGEDTRLNSEFRNMIRKIRAGDSISFQVQRGKTMNNLVVEISSRNMTFKDIIQLRRIAGGIVRPADDKFIARVERATSSSRPTTSRSLSSAVMLGGKR